MAPSDGSGHNGPSPDPRGVPDGERSPWAAPVWDPAPVQAPGEGAGGIPAPVTPSAAAAGPLDGYGGHLPPEYAAGPHPWPPVPPPPAPPPRTRWGLGAYLAVEAVFLLASVAVSALLGQRLSSSAAALAVALVVPTLLAAGLAVLITIWRGNGPRIDLGLRFSWRDVGLGVAFGVAGLVITIPASLLYLAIVGSDTTSAVGQEFAGIRSGPWLAALVFVIVVFVAPLCEEIVYRGLLWGAVERLGARRWWALVITTVVFALAHFEFARTPLLLVVAIPIALARLRTGRLTAGVVAHGVNNLLPAVSLVLMLLGVMPGT